MKKSFKNPFGNNTQKENAKTTQKVGHSQKTKAKAYNEALPPNEFDETQKATEISKAYEVAGEKLRPKSYAERKFKQKERIVQLRDFYPYLSIFLSLSVGILAGDLFASGLSDIAYYGTLSILTIAVFAVSWLMENIKKNSAHDFYGGNSSAKNILVLSFCYSLLVSGVGGYVASAHLNDKSAEIEQSFQNQSDSIATGYGEQIAVLDGIIQEN